MTGVFTKTFLELIKPGHHILDLGAGQEDFARMFVEKGALVTAVDVEFPTTTENNIISKRIKVEDFCAVENTEKYDLVFVRNILQFLDKNWTFEALFPWINEHVVTNGIVAIETFYQNPEPPFEHLFTSLYRLNEMTTHFMTWEEIYAKEYSHNGLDMSGQPRKFFVSGLIVKKV